MSVFSSDLDGISASVRAQITTETIVRKVMIPQCLHTTFEEHFEVDKKVLSNLVTELLSYSFGELLSYSFIRLISYSFTELLIYSSPE